MLMDAASGRAERQAQRTQASSNASKRVNMRPARRGKKQHIKTVVYTKVPKRGTGLKAGHERVSSAVITEREQPRQVPRNPPAVGRIATQTDRQRAPPPKPVPVDAKAAAKSPSKVHTLEPSMQKRCSSHDHSQSTYLKSTDGLHLLYPETWSGVDFVYHKVVQYAVS